MRSAMLILFAALFLVSCSGTKKLSDAKLTELNYQEAERFAAENSVLPDQYPMYPDGGLGFVKDMKKEQVYPATMRNSGIKGTVHVAFTVSKDGKIENVIVKESLHPKMDAEAVRVIKTLNKWYPAKFQDKFVDCNMGTPFYFDEKEETKLN